MDRDAHPLDPDVPRVESSARRRRHDNAQAFQFAHDPLIAPARVFARDPPNQFSCLGTDRATASSATMRPRPGDQPTMPVEQCGRLDDEFLACLGRAFGTEVTLGAVLRKARFWEKYARVQVNDRQRDVINRLLDGFTGKLTTTKWAKLEKCSHDTALRDIQGLIAGSPAERPGWWLRCSHRAADGMEAPGEEHRANRARVLDSWRQADFAEQRASTSGVSGVRVGRTAARD